MWQLQLFWASPDLQTQDNTQHFYFAGQFE
jgi:hypothetical protein